MNQPYEFQEEEFDDYLDGGMHRDQRAEFEARLTADPELRKAFDFHQVLRKNLHRRSEYAKNKAEVARIRDEMLKQAPAHRRFPFRIWGGVLLLLLTVAAGVWYFWPEPPLPPVNPVPPPRPAVPRPDSMKPAGIMDTLKRPVVENKKGRTEKERPDLEMGSKKSYALLKEMSATQHVVQKGNVERAAGTKIFKLTVFEISRGRPESHRTGQGIELHLPKSQIAVSENWRLIELVVGAESSLYLQSGSDFYPIQEGSHFLLKESDETRKKWLRQ